MRTIIAISTAYIAVTHNLKLVGKNVFKEFLKTVWGNISEEEKKEILRNLESFQGIAMLKAHVHEIIKHFKLVKPDWSWAET